MRTSEIQGKLWGTYARNWADYGEGTSNDLFNAVLQKTKNTDKGIKLLDVGCGAGGYCKMASEQGFNVSGYDASEQLIAIARERLPQADFQTGDLEDLPYSDNTFDIVTGFNCFQFAGNIVNALHEAGRVTKKGGTVVIAVWGSPEKCEASVVFAALAPFMPTPQKSNDKKPLYAEGILESLAVEAGLYPETTEEIECLWKFEDENMALKAMLSAGVMSFAIQNAGEEKVRETVRNAISQFRQHSGNYELKNTFNCLAAKV